MLAVLPVTVVNQIANAFEEPQPSAVSLRAIWPIHSPVGLVVIPAILILREATWMKKSKSDPLRIGERHSAVDLRAQDGVVWRSPCDPRLEHWLCAGENGSDWAGPSGNWLSVLVMGALIFFFYRICRAKL